MVIPNGKLFQHGGILPQDGNVASLDSCLRQQHIQVMLVGHGAILYRLHRFLPGSVHDLIDQGELALCQSRQRASVELVALPCLRLA